MSYFPYWLSFLEGFLSFISPCILPLLPIYFFYLAGVTTVQDIHPGRLITNSFAFVTGFTIVFVLLGATATTVGGFLQQNNRWFQPISGLVMIILGLNFTGIFKIRWLNTDRQLGFDPTKLNFFKSVLFGIVFAFAWTPCVGPLLGAALLMAGNLETITEGIILLLFYSAGLGLPFLLSAGLFELLGKKLQALQRYARIISIISGLVLIVAGTMILTNHMFYLGSW